MRNGTLYDKVIENAWRDWEDCLLVRTLEVTQDDLISILIIYVKGLV